MDWEFSHSGTIISHISNVFGSVFHVKFANSPRCGSDQYTHLNVDGDSSV